MRRKNATASLVLAVILLATAFSNLPSSFGSEENIVDIGQWRKGIGFNPTTNLVYHTNYISNFIEVRDGSTLKVISTITVGERGFTSLEAIAVNPHTNMIYVTDSESMTVFAINGSTNELESKIFAPKGITGIAVNPNTNRVYVASYLVDQVVVIDGSTNELSGDAVTVGSGPTGVAVNPKTNMIYVANYGANSVSVIDGAKNVVSTINVERRPIGIAVNSDTNTVYVVSQGDHISGSLSVINGGTNVVASSIPIPSAQGMASVAVNTNTNKVYVSGRSGLSIYEIDGGTNERKILKVGLVDGVTVDSSTNRLLLTNAYGSSVSVVDMSLIDVQVSRIENVANGLGGMTVNPINNRIFILTESIWPVARSSMCIIDGLTNELADCIYEGLPDEPVDLTVNPSTNMIYVVDRESNLVTAIDGSTNKVVDIIVMGETLVEEPVIAVNPNTNRIYVTHMYSVSVIDGTTNNVVDTIEMKDESHLGIHIFGLAVNPNTNKVYITKYDFAIKGCLENYLYVIDGNTNKIVDTIEVGRCPEGVDVNPVTNTIYVASSGFISVIDGKTNKIVDTLGITGYLAVNANSNLLYVGRVNSVSVVDGSTNSVITTIGIGHSTGGVAVNPKTGKIYVTGSGDVLYDKPKSISIIEGSVIDAHRPSSSSTTSTTPPPVDISKEVSEERKFADISVNMKQTKKTTLVSVKNNGDEPIYGIKLHISEGSIKFVKARGWDREKVDSGTVMLSTAGKPIASGRTVILLLITDNPNAPIKWSAFDIDHKTVGSGSASIKGM